MTTKRIACAVARCANRGRCSDATTVEAQEGNRSQKSAFPAPVQLPVFSGLVCGERGAEQDAAKMLKAMPRETDSPRRRVAAVTLQQRAIAMLPIRRPLAASWLFCLSIAFFTTNIGRGQTAAGPPTETPVSQLIGVLQSDASVYDKAMTCRALSVVGNADAVAALAPLLADPRLATYARSALEVIPGAAADAALRGAVDHLNGELLIGALDSIGKRRDAAAVDAVARRVADSDPAIADAAARALGSIGNQQTAQVLRKELSSASAARRPAIATACLMNADALLQQPDQRGAALSLYEAVRSADLPEHLRLAATQRMILAKGEQALELLAEQLMDDEPAQFRSALQTARQLGSDATTLLIQRYPQVDASRRALIVIALGDIGGDSVLPLLRSAAQSPDAATRLQAIAALGRLQDDAALDLLLEASADDDPEIAATAQAALSELPGERVETVVADRFLSEDAALLLSAVAIARGRRMASATPALLRLAQHDDPAVRSAAVSALGWTVGSKQLAHVIDLAVTTPDPQVRQAAVDALSAACARLPRPVCVDQLSRAMERTSGNARLMLLEQIAAVGGPEALQTVADQARRGDDATRDAATRLLGEWLSADAAPHLLALAQNLREPKYRIRALRGYVRCARQLDMTPEQRLEVCRNVLEVADRKEEKLLIFEVLRRFPSVDGLQLAVSLLSDAQLRDQAARTILATADSVAQSAAPQVRMALDAVARSEVGPGLRQQAQQRLQQLE